MATLLPIPQPPSIPLIGNITSLDKDLPTRGFHRLAKQYGEIYQLNLVGRVVVFVSSYALVNELSDDSRFRKSVGSGALKETRNLVHDGIFTAFNDEPNWAIAHRLLTPAFGAVPIRDMFEDMRDISYQLVLKWERSLHSNSFSQIIDLMICRFGPNLEIDPTDDLTRVALDTIALCSMSYRLNSFYTHTQPVFVRAMMDFLTECNRRANRPGFIQAFMTNTNDKYETDIRILRETADKIVADRRLYPTEKRDILYSMMNEKDPKTGLKLSDESITNNLLTFLIAGHETTSGVLCFVIYYLLKHPDVMRKLQKEVDGILGDEPAQLGDFSKMPYLNAVLRETLRLQPTAAIRVVYPPEDTVIGRGKYFVKAGQAIALQIWDSHRDPSVWSDDAEEFRPERMLDGKFEAAPPNAWQPFGFGLRGCIGRPFSWQEMSLVITSIIQRLDLSLVDPSYTLEITQAITIKPKNLRIYAKPRQQQLPRRRSLTPDRKIDCPVSLLESNRHLKRPLYVYYGSNTGSSEAFARTIAREAHEHGFRSSIGTLNSTVGHLPTDGPIVIVTASFEGEPADNANQFVPWMTSLLGHELDGIRFAIFGCGNHEWRKTYQRIPRLCDVLLEKRGGRRLIDRGEGDAADGNIFDVFEQFKTSLWDVLSREYHALHDRSLFDVQVLDSRRAEILQHSEMTLSCVRSNVLLTRSGFPAKHHIELELPHGMTYRVGDYLSILPQNPPRDIHRVFSHFRLPFDQEASIRISAPGTALLPVGERVPLSSILSEFVELSQPATKDDIVSLLDFARSDSSRRYLRDLMANHTHLVTSKRLSVLDILEQQDVDHIDLPLVKFIRMLPSIRPRQYSISSSPLWNSRRVCLTFSVLDSPPLCTSKTRSFLGVASNHLANLHTGDQVLVTVRRSVANSHLLSDPSRNLVMICAGSGFAPVRGFIQERAMRKRAGEAVGKMLLFVGCRSPDGDFLYSDTDLKEWVDIGLVDVRVAFSQCPDKSQQCCYVQDRILLDKTEMRDALLGDALFFVCGYKRVVSAVKNTLTVLLLPEGVSGPGSLAQASVELDNLLAERYFTDVLE
ncbi:fatty acid hydroxylase [Desarmillaria tabescens]|uniref:Fatty acid hydroxylase n=1 Tax=Armillaria tabescens TaxID=1929756 RepID=A0AA39K1R8_ARMTA|nr:fatty acid hydroxylase [Desarmillaria tabescens]KAK0452920.1 fatty acid hydroxylase [Desarmillaria tabescens]